MKILGINGSPRGPKSQTPKLVESVLSGAKASGSEVELIDVCRLKINYCNACGVCYAEAKCVHEDDFEDLYNKILDGDGLVLASPVYFRSITAQLKTLIDRMADAIHCQLLTGKYGCAVATAGSPNYAEVTDYLSRIIIGFGASVVGSVGATPSIPGDIEAKKKVASMLGQTLVDAIKTKRAYPEQDEIHNETRKRFRSLVEMNEDIWTHEYEHWKKMGWL
ncbi:MAG: flavodoxin family protein [Methanotrichaceae archaeon]|nr:flavodoxin family protein [Methanotrichaceae archaeon]